MVQPDLPRANRRRSAQLLDALSAAAWVMNDPESLVAFLMPKPPIDSLRCVLQRGKGVVPDGAMDVIAVKHPFKSHH
jgi:hypothetical protein